MSFAIRKDGKSWRSVGGPDEVNPDEVFSETQPDAIVDLAADIRGARQRLLVEADFAINKAEDAGLDSAALRRYRQALRDITNQSGFPATVTWPVFPQN